MLTTRKFCFIVVSMVVGAMLVSKPAFSQATVAVADTIDVAGVKLGMTPQQVTAALKEYDPSLSITDNTTNPTTALGNDIWSSSFTISAISSDMAKVNDLEAAEKTSDSSCTANNSNSANGYLTCVNNLTTQFNADLPSVVDTPRAIVVYFSPVVGQEKVIAVTSTELFIKSIPTVNNAVAAALKKYPLTPSVSPTGSQQSDQTIVWFFDPRHRLVSPTQAQQMNVPQLGAVASGNFTCNITIEPLASGNDSGSVFNGPSIPTFCPSPELPSRVVDGDGISLVVDVPGNGVVNPFASTPEPANPLLASSLNIVLYNGTALYNYNSQAQSYLRNLQNTQNQNNAQQSQGVSPKI